MNVTYLTLDSVSNPIVRSQVIEYLTYLSDEFKITLVSFEGKKDSYAFELVDSILSKHNISWHRIPYSNKFNFISIGWSLFVAPFKIYPLIKRSNTKLIHARSMLPAAIALLMSLFIKCKVIYDIRGFWVDEKADINRIKKNGIFYKILSKLDKIVYKKSDAVVTVAKRSVDLILKNYAIPICKVNVITNTVNTSTFPLLTADDRTEIRKSMGFAETDIVFIHAGALRGYYDFSLELKLFTRLLCLNPAFKFVILSKEDKEWIKTKFIQNNISPDCYRIVESDFSKVHRFLNAADYSLFLIIPTYSKISAFPVKFAESIATFLPVISNAGVGDVEDYFAQFNVGLCLNYHDVENDPELGAKQIYNWIARYEKDENEFKKLMDQHLNKKIAYQSYQKIYRSLLGKNEVANEKEIESINI